MSLQTAEQGRRIYSHGRGLRLILSISFALILLFVVNAGAGAIWLATHNLPSTALVFGLMFILGLVILLYIGIFLFAASHMELELGESYARMVLPSWRGPTPFFPYTEIEVPYSNIAAVETRGEIYRYFILPTMMRAVSVVNRDGDRLTLGYMREDDTDTAVELDQVAQELAQRAGVEVVKRGVVDGGNRFRVLVQDEPPWDTPECTPDVIKRAKIMERVAWISVGLVLAALIIGALVLQAIELYNAGTAT
jgi:hypothetical protein